MKESAKDNISGLEEARCRSIDDGLSCTDCSNLVYKHGAVDVRGLLRLIGFVGSHGVDCLRKSCCAAAKRLDALSLSVVLESGTACT